MITLECEPNSPTANSYVSLEEFDAYLEAHPFGAAALSKPEETKKAALVTSTIQLDTLCYEGVAATSTQMRAFGRTGLSFNGYIFEGTVIPQQIKLAQMELARLMLVSQSDITSESVIAQLGLNKLKVSSIELGFSSKKGDFQPIPKSVMRIIPAAWICSEVGEYEFEFRVY